MTCWSTKEHWETALGLATEGSIVVFDHILISKVSVLIEPLEMLRAEAVAPQTEDLKAEDVLNPLCLVCIFKKLNLS